jgi:hypothetical protein
VEKPDGTVIDGYFRGANRNTCSISLSPHHTREDGDVVSSIGVKTLFSMKKINVDRLGNRTEVISEKRTWRGAVCT